jgi:DNA-binding transcriptional LysR family regulator
MELRHLRYFLAVAEELNFRKAAERVGIAQPPLSSQIHDLERELGVRLFRRVSRGTELTEAGVAFLAEVPAIFERVAHATRMAQRGGRGEVGQLRVGFTGSTAFNEVVPRSLRDFRRAFPEVALTLEELNTPQLLEGLGRQRLDAIFIRPGPEKPPGSALLSLGDETMMALLPSGHRLADRRAIALKDLAGEPMVLFSRALGPALYDEVIEACRRAGFEPVIGQVAPQITSISNLVAVELGVSIVPARLANAAVPGVVFLPFVGDAPVARLALATRLDDHSVITRNFVAAVKKARTEK